MKRIVFILSFVLASTALFAQTALPTTWDFTGGAGAAPNGWTLNNTFFYTGSGAPAPALKFSATGASLEIFFSEAPGPLTYDMTGNSFSGGTFEVQESVDGSTWTTMRTVTNPPSGSYTGFTDNPAAASRYVRFFYTNKVSGNIGLDNVLLSKAAAGPAAEINIRYGSMDIVSGSDFVAGNASSTPLAIDNLGTDSTLHIYSYAFTGTDASMFSLSGISTPDVILAEDSLNINLVFTPTGAQGTKYATLTVNSNDADEAAYVFNIIAINGQYATEPAAQPTNLQFTNVKSYEFDVDYTASASAENYIVLRKTAAAVTETPVDGTTYTRGDYIGGAQVAYYGDNTGLAPNFIVASTDYHFAVFAVAGPQGYENYLTTSPLTGSVTSTSADIGNYYAGVDPMAASFITDLHNAIYNSSYYQVYYSWYASRLIDNFESRDTIGGQKVVTCAYTGHQHVYTEPFMWDVLSREHTFASSWMPTNGIGGFNDREEYSDLHNLFPIHFDYANTIRSNNPLGVVVGTPTYEYMGGKLGRDANNNPVYEPRDIHKGDAARAMMYMMVCFEGVDGYHWQLPSNPAQSQAILKQWHQQDPPDNWEIARNDYIQSVQGNRNPFIDSINFVNYIDFSDLSYLGIGDKFSNDLLVEVFPNPAIGQFFVRVPQGENGNMIVRLSDLSGRLVLEESVAVSGSESVHAVNTAELNGIFLLSLELNGKLYRKKLSVQ